MEAEGNRTYPFPGPLVEIIFGLRCTSEMRAHYTNPARTHLVGDVRLYEIRRIKIRFALNASSSAYAPQREKLPLSLNNKPLPRFKRIPQKLTPRSWHYLLTTSSPGLSHSSKRLFEVTQTLRCFGASRESRSAIKCCMRKLWIVLHGAFNWTGVPSHLGITRVWP